MHRFKLLKGQYNIWLYVPLNSIKQTNKQKERKKKYSVKCIINLNVCLMETSCKFTEKEIISLKKINRKNWTLFAYFQTRSNE